MTPHSNIRWFFVLLGLIGTGSIYAQSEPQSSPGSQSQEKKSEEEVVHLSPFSVTAEQVGPYQTADSASASRVSVNLFDSQKSINVVTSQLMTDLGANSPLNALKYFPGITSSTEPEGSGAERLGFRGYQVVSGLVDGMDNSSYLDLHQLAPFVERIEVVMGSDSVMSASSVPGGTMNIVTKKPQFQNFGSASVQLGEYGTNRASLDINRTIGDNYAARFIVSGIDNTVYGIGKQHGVGALLSLSRRFSNRSVATLQYIYRKVDVDGGSGGEEGIPLDPTVGTLSTDAFILSGLKPDAGERIFANNPRTQEDQMLSFFYDVRLNSFLSTRLSARAQVSERWQLLSVLSPALGLGGAYDPLTGNYTPGFTYGPAPTFTPIPAVQPDAMYVASTNELWGKPYSYSIQNDYALEFDRQKYRLQTLIGMAANWSNSDNYGYDVPAPAFNIFTAPLAPNLAQKKFINTTETHNSYFNLYVNQVIKVFDNDRLQMNVGVTKTWNQLETIRSDVPAPFSSDPEPLAVNYGATFKITPQWAAYYGHSEGAQPQNNLPTSVPRIDKTSSEQDEAGMRFKLLQGKGTATVAYYEIHENNFAVNNPLNLASPAPVPRAPNLLLNRVARGWEFNINASVTRELSTILSWTTFTNRTPDDIPIRGTAEKSGAAWVHYDGHTGALKGFGFGAGYVYRDKVVGDTAAGYTAASSPDHLIPNQPRFYLPSVGQLNLTASYKRDSWAVRVFLDNVLDEDYVASSISRTFVYSAIPRNFRVQLDYSF